MEGSSGVASTGGAPGGASTGMAESSTGAAAFMGWGDDWRRRIAGENQDELKRLERFQGPENIYQSYRELEKRLSAGELKPTLKKDATPEEVARWRQEAGIPTKPEEYKITMPAGRKPPAEDDAFLNSFLKGAHEANFTQGQVDQAIKSFYAEVDRQEQTISEAEKAAEQATEDALRKEWGQDYRPNKAMAEALLDRAPAGFRDRFMNGYLADHTPIKASPEAWKWLVQMEREINPAATVVPGASGDVGKTITAELTELKMLMANQDSKYWKGPESEALQERYRQLIDAETRMKERAA